MTHSGITKFLATGRNRPARMLCPLLTGIAGGLRVAGWPNMRPEGDGPQSSSGIRQASTFSAASRVHRVNRFTVEGMTHSP